MRLVPVGPEILVEKRDGLGKGLGMGKGERNECALDGYGVDGEAGGSGFGDGDIEVGAPADAFGIDPFVFVLGL